MVWMSLKGSTCCWSPCACWMLIAVLLLLAACSYFANENDMRKITKGRIFNITDDPNNTQKNDKLITNLPAFYQKYCEIMPSCEGVNCFGIPEMYNVGNVISTFIKNDFKVNCQKSTISLTVENSIFLGNQLQEHWLETDVKIARLNLISCNLTTLSDRAFASPIFKQMTTLYLKDNNISTLKKATFQCLPKLQYLSIVNNEINEAEENLLYVTPNLENLELENATKDTDVLQNITGKDELRNIQILALESNYFRIIDSNVFTGVKTIKSLYLRRSIIGTISKDAFKPFSGFVNQIFLNYNCLSTLPEGLLDSIIENNPEFQLSIENNPWHCDCNLKWVQDIMIRHPGVVIDKPTCTSPLENVNKFLANANLCNQTTMMNPTTSTTDTTTSMKPNTTTSMRPDTTTSMRPNTTTSMRPDTTTRADCNTCSAKDIIAIIVTFVISLIIMCVLSAVIMFVIVRCNPAMLRGSKRILMVKRGNLDAMVLPKGLSSDTIESANENTIPTTSQNLKEDIYVIPLPPVQNTTRKNSRCSALSAQSDCTSYVSYVEPTILQLNLRRFNKSRHTGRETEPPPLPPHPHPILLQPLSIVTDMDEDEFDSCTV